MFCRSWDDSTFDGTGHHRQVNYTLGTLCRLHYPGMVNLPSGERIHVTSWDQYRFHPDVDHQNAQGAVWADFWVSYHRRKLLFPHFVAIVTLTFRINFAVAFSIASRWRLQRPCLCCFSPQCSEGGEGLNFLCTDSGNQLVFQGD